MIEVTQADRDRAKEIEAFFGAVWPEGNFNGLIEYLARHRLASQAAAIRAAIEAAATECDRQSHLSWNCDRRVQARLDRDNIRALSVEQIMKGMGE